MIFSQLRLRRLTAYCLLVFIWSMGSAAAEIMMPGPIGNQAVPQLQQDHAISDRVSVLVHLEHPGKYVSVQMSQMRRQAVKDWVASVGGKVKHEYGVVLPYTINIRNLPRESLRGLQMRPGVVGIEEDRIMKAHLTVSTPLVKGLQEQIAGAGYSADGSGVRVCVIDTGIDSDHIMFKDRNDATAGKNFVNDDAYPDDDNGHGTNVAGIVLGGTGITIARCGGSAIIQGVAPEATLIGVKVLDAAGSGWTSDVIAGIDYCADQSASGGRSQVINLSLGGGEFSGNCDTDSTAQAANNAVDAGIVVVASSGNEAYANAMSSPACGSKVIAVGAVYDDNFPNCEYDQDDSFSWCGNTCDTILCSDTAIEKDDLICFSNRSAAIDVVAPGCVITSADNSTSTAVSGMCGTSQASPHVAGLAALLLGEDSLLSPALVRQYIRDGAVDDLFITGFDSGYGYGRIDVINSLSFLNSGCNTDAECDNNLYCDGVESCVAGECQAGTAFTCDDGVSCTDDSCNEDAESCDNVINHGYCNDGLFCNGEESCDGVLGCIQGSVSCTIGEECDETTNTCQAQICDGDRTCELGENCGNCPSDCISSGTSGGTDASACTKGKTDGICHPKEIGTACPDCAVSYCCGDGVCGGIENSESCLIDCPLPPSCETTETIEKSCADGKDNDCDGYTDTNDTDCESLQCLLKGDPCSSNGDCCSNKCLPGVCK